ncbi:MAG TPA: precorrin-3B C(17)-methyltransferase [Acidimicrobiales bacterium]|nr:precorrin-3B C(17)-methyltransferase [Acidimicrobiales bacterium]
MTRVVSCSVTAAGAAVARRLPYEHHPGSLLETVRQHWGQVDGLVLIGAMGIAVRAVAPRLGHKGSDPAVVSVDDGGRYAIALVGGHAAGANDLAQEVASLLGATPVITTATDAAGVPALDQLPGYRAEGHMAAVTRMWLDGEAPVIAVDPDLGLWPLPGVLSARSDHQGGKGRVTVTDQAGGAGPNEVFLRPPSIVLGVGSSSGADPDRLWQLATGALARARLAPAAVAAVATIDIKVHEPAIVRLAERLGVPVRGFEAPVLTEAARDRRVPNPSEVVAGAVGTPSVAEAAALVAAGPGSSLVLAKQVAPDSTVAVARRSRPEGHLAVVGLGPGGPGSRTLEAVAAVRHAQVVTGYERYVDLASDLITPGQVVLRYPIGSEEERCRDALDRAAGGSSVALVCSGDPGVYAMASLVCELAPAAGDPPLTIVPGVTAALSAAGVLGAPLGHDHASISLSDLLTPWDVISGRIRAVAQADFVVSFYNPRSSRRAKQLGEALDLLRPHRPPATPAAVLTDIGRPRQRVTRGTIATLEPDEVDMLSLVVIGSSRTRWVGSRMVTPRGYRGEQ